MRRLDVGTNRHVYAVEYDKDDEHQGCNIKMNVRIAGVDARFWGFYDLTELTLSKIDAGARDDEQDQFDTVAFQEFMRDINENVNDIQRAILDELHMHSRRRGLWSYYRAEQFFENTNAPIYTALQVLGDHKVLLFSSDKQKLKSEMARRLSELGA
jgi:hypothetical protein